MISTGSETQNSDGTWTLKAEKVRDFAVIAGNGFEKLSAKAGDVTVNSWYYSGSDSDKLQGEVSLKAAVDAVNAFESAWGEYPYKTLDVAQTPYDAGGMEYPGLVRIADSFADGLSGEQALEMLKRLNTVVYVQDFEIKDVAEVMGYDDVSKKLIYHHITFE